MKKIIALFSLLTLFLVSGTAYAQDNADEQATDQTEQMQEEAQQETETTTQEESVAPAAAEEGSKGSIAKVLKDKFIEGGPAYMFPILVCLILGLAVAIERIITLNLATVNRQKLLGKVDSALQAGNIEDAVNVSKATKGPVAGILYQGIDRIDEGLDVVEKSVSSYGSVLAGRLEKGMSWLALFIAIAPMLGFMGTVIGMIQAFGNIAKQGDVDIAFIAKDINVALLTTVFGLIVAIILQIFYNYILAKIDGLINDMEDASVSLIDMLVKYKLGR